MRIVCSGHSRDKLEAIAKILGVSVELASVADDDTDAVAISITDKAAIFGSVRAFGGQYRTELTPDTTHLVTLTMTPPITKTALAQSKLPQPFDHPHLIKSTSNEPTGNGLKLILPHYFDDCVKVKRRVHEDLYLFPEPKLFAVWDDVGPLGSA
ncbi:hypothetical protein HDU80_006406, partial [Chytriomyces hyalinus]